MAVRAWARVHVRVFTQPSWTTAAWPALTWHYEVTAETIMGTIHAAPHSDTLAFILHSIIIHEVTTITWIDISYMRIVLAKFVNIDDRSTRWLVACSNWRMICLEWNVYVEATHSFRTTSLFVRIYYQACEYQHSDTTFSKPLFWASGYLKTEISFENSTFMSLQSLETYQNNCAKLVCTLI